MDCSECSKLISAYIDGELSDRDAADVDAHLAQCPECSALLNDCREVDRITRRSVELVMPGKGFPRRVADELPPPRAGFGRWQGPLAFLLMTIVTIAILVAVRRSGNGRNGTAPEEDLQREMTLVTSDGSRRIKTPVDAASGSAPAVLELPYKARAVFIGRMAVKWTKSGVHLVPEPMTALLVHTPENALRDVLIHLPGGKAAGLGRMFAAAVHTGRPERWSIYALAGKPRIADVTGENRVEIPVNRKIEEGKDTPVYFDRDEIAGLLAALDSLLPETPLLPYSASGLADGLALQCPSGLDFDAATKMPGAGSGITAALSLIGPRKNGLLYLKRTGQTVSVIRENMETPWIIPESETPKLLLASASIGIMVATEAGNIYGEPAAGRMRENILARTAVERLKDVAWEPYRDLAYICGPGGVAAVNTAAGVLAWQETKLKDIVGIGMDEQGNAVCAGADGTITVLSADGGKAAAVYGPVGQGFALPPFVAEGKIAALGENGRLVTVTAGKAAFREIPGFPGADAWGMRGEFVYFRREGEWYGWKAGEAEIAREGGGAWALSDIFGLVRGAGGAVRGSRGRTAALAEEGFPLLLPDGLLVVGSGQNTFIPFHRHRSR